MENRILEFLNQTSKDMTQRYSGVYDPKNPKDREVIKQLIADELKAQYGIDIELLNFRR